MKRLLILLSLLYVFPAYASCEGGTEITGKNGHVYCMSNVLMNWYSAFAWCDSQGRTLVTMEQACDIDETERWDGGVGEGKCLNMVEAGSNRNAWSSIPYEHNLAYYITLSTGSVFTAHRTPTYSALCR